MLVTARLSSLKDRFACTPPRSCRHSASNSMSIGRIAETDTLRTVRALRYVTALREGGSLPGLVEADDDGLYVLKFRGAGQGPKALVAEIVSGQLARALGM